MILEATISTTVRDMIPNMFRSIEIKLIALFDERYVVVSSIVDATATVVVAATTSPREKDMPY